jgi:SAM-dependent methyltransferase
MDAAYITTHVEEEERHWWFMGRREVILRVMRQVFRSRDLMLAEIGCGSGFLLESLSEFGSVIGVEASEEFLRLARLRGRQVLRGSLPRDIPVEAGSLDGALLLDVLEHIEDEAEALRAVRRLLKPSGTLLCTVPAYQFLWSGHDVVLGHRRRYTARGLRSSLERAGFRVSRLTYFNMLLAVPIAAARLVRKSRGSAAHDLIPLSPRLNRFLAGIFAWEGRLLRHVSFPFGISILAVAHPKPGGE